MKALLAATAAFLTVNLPLAVTAAPAPTHTAKGTMIYRSSFKTKGIKGWTFTGSGA